MKNLKFILLMLGSAWCCEVVAQDLSVKEFQSKMDSVTGEVLIDLRTPDEVTKGIIPGAVQIDYFQKDFESRISALDKSKTYFIYCAAGGRSGETYELMQKLGFTHVYNLTEGFNGWKKQNMPIAPYKK